MTLLSNTQVVQCLLVSAGVWLPLLYLAKESHYVGDDFTVLRPLFNGGIVESLHTYVRPLEFLAAYLSLQAQLPIWLLFSLPAYVGTAIATLALANLVTGNFEAPW
jgi:hypothetical protein